MNKSKTLLFVTLACAWGASTYSKLTQEEAKKCQFEMWYECLKRPGKDKNCQILKEFYNNPNHSDISEFFWGSKRDKAYKAAFKKIRQFCNSKNIDPEFVDIKTLILARNKLFSLNTEKWVFYCPNEKEKSLLALKFIGLPIPVEMYPEEES